LNKNYKLLFKTIERMKKILLSSILALSVIASANSQEVYKDGFTGGNTTTSPSTGSSAGYTATRTNPTSNEMVLTRTAGASAQYTAESYTLYSNPQYASSPTNATLTSPISMVGVAGSKDTIFVIAKSSVAGTTLRVDIQDASTPPVTSDYNVTNFNTLTTSYALYKYVYAVPQQAYSGAGCSTATPCAVDKAHIKTILVSVNNGTVNTGDATIDYMQIGGTASAIVVNAAGGGGDPSFIVTGTTAVTAAQANISSTKLYPNPVSDMANVELNLLSTSDVKVTLTDVMGKEVMTIANGTMASLSESFSVSNLHKGIYTVNYFINGSAAKAELLMVK
jgi:hypothetical protein